jgi:hypothetical protein
MGEASGMYGEEDRCIQGLKGNMKARDHLEDLGAEVIRRYY